MGDGQAVRDYELEVNDAARDLGGRLTLEEIAAVLDVSPSTVSRDWKTAQLFLRSQWQP